MANTIQRTPGKVEAHLAKDTGLRRFSYVAMLGSGTGDVVAAAAPTKGTLTSATIANGRLCYPSTVCVTINQTAGVTGGLAQLTIKGIDQFGNYAEEITPTVTVTAVQFNHIYCAQVFSVITSVQYLVSGLGTTLLSVGPRFDFVRTEDASNHHVGGLNLGIGIPMQMQYVPQGVFAANRATRDLVIPPEPKRAFGVLTFSANAADAETVTIDGIVYTFKTGALTTANDVKVGADKETSAANLQKAIDLSGVAGTDYHAGTGRHPTVRGRGVVGAVLTVEARRPGAEGNLIATTETLGSGAWAATKLGSGRSSSGEVEGLTLQTFKAAGQMAKIAYTDFTVGYNETGWSGSIEKLSILNSASIGNYVVGDLGMLVMNLRSHATGW